MCLGATEVVAATRVALAPPGGRSTICLGMEGLTAAAPVSSNAFACGAAQNSGNVLTERPSTQLHAPPGGRSTICLGHEKEAPKENVQVRPVGGEDHIWSARRCLEEPAVTPRVPAGGLSSVCLGTDKNDYSLSSRVLGLQPEELVEPPEEPKAGHLVAEAVAERLESEKEEEPKEDEDPEPKELEGRKERSERARLGREAEELGD